MYEKTIRIFYLIFASLWPVFVFLFTHIARIDAGNFPLIGPYHHTLLYFAQTSVVSYSYTDPLYGFEVLYHPLTFIYEGNFALIASISLFMIVLLTLLLMQHKGFSNKVLFLTCVIFSVVGYIQASAHLSISLLVHLTYILFVLFLFTRKQKMWTYLAITMSPMIFLFGIHFVIIFLVFLYLVVPTNMGRTVHYFYSLFFIACATLVIFIFKGNILSIPPLDNHAFSIFEFGDINGISLVLVILGVITGLFSWNKEYRSLYLVTLVFAAMSFMDRVYYLPLSFLFSLSIAHFIIHIDEKPWVVDATKIIIAVGFFCCMTLSFFIFSEQIIRAAPTPEQVTVAEFLRQNTDPGDTFLASQEFGVYLEAIAFRRGIEPSFYFDVDQSVYQFNKLPEFQDHLQANNIKYVVIDRPITESLNNSLVGIRMLVTDRGAFQQLYASENISVWQVR